jgi:FkbH-like protein
MKNIKLVIWDLDETFWKGTLSEEGVNCIRENIELVKWLTGRGIINSIVSKNNFSQAKKKLQEIGVWEYFIFPEIEWEGKGKLVRRVIEKCQLRAENTLFLDDNHMNLEEAKFYNKGICVEFPSFIPQIKEHPAFAGKNDSTHSRLGHYKILEKKYIARSEQESNEEFLLASDIKIQLIDADNEYKDRLHELLNRTNQLNYTKKRLNESEVDELINNSEGIEKKLIKVIDKYGDYGIAGFYAFDREKNKLDHFVFSCRIINLGVEQYLYEQLNFPEMDIVPDVAVELDHSKPNWISVIEDNKLSKEKPNEQDEKEECTIFFKGECDLNQMLFYLRDYKCKLIKETNYNGKNNIAINREHTQMVIDSLELSSAHKEYLENKLPFIDEQAYKTRIFSANYDVFVYSLNMDYIQEVYEHKTNGTKATFGTNNIVLTNKQNWCNISKAYRKKRWKEINAKFLKFFSDQFIHKGKISVENFKKNLTKIRSSIPSHVPIVFLNGAEVKFTADWEDYSTNRIKEMNLALDEFISDSYNCYLVDLRKIVQSSKDLTYSYKRYNRHCYKKIAFELIDILKKVNNKSITKNRIALTPLMDVFKPFYRLLRRHYYGVLRVIKS